MRISDWSSDVCSSDLLSGGLRQRAVIAMALVCRPALLIADEPTTAHDVTIPAQILKLLKDLQAELGMAVLIIHHDLGVVANVAAEVVVLYHGEHRSDERRVGTDGVSAVRSGWGTEHYNKNT